MQTLAASAALSRDRPGTCGAGRRTASCPRDAPLPHRLGTMRARRTSRSSGGPARSRSSTAARRSVARLRGRPPGPWRRRGACRGRSRRSLGRSSRSRGTRPSPSPHWFRSRNRTRRDRRRTLPGPSGRRRGTPCPRGPLLRVPGLFAWTHSSPLPPVCTQRLSAALRWNGAPLRWAHGKKVILAAPRGYCAGVDRAVQMVERALETSGRPSTCARRSCTTATS